MSWITEKDLMVSQKIHIDNDFIQSLLKRIESLELELATHSNQVADLQNQADAFVKRGITCCHHLPDYLPFKGFFFTFP